MLEENVITTDKQLNEQVILIGCGGHQTHPKCVYEVEIEVYGVQYLVPILVVPGQKDDFILGSNVIKYIMHQMKSSDNYWRVTAQSCDMSLSPDTSLFFDMMAGLTRWQGVDTPNKIGTVKLGGVAVDPEKVGVISRMTKNDLMEDDGVTPSVKRVKSFLGMVLYY